MLVQDFVDLYSENPELAKQLHTFYDRKFILEDVPIVFKGWRIEEKGEYVYIINQNPQGWETPVRTHDNFEYTFQEENGCTSYFPKKMHQFISDCLREEDIHLEFNESFLRKLKIEHYFKNK